MNHSDLPPFGWSEFFGHWTFNLGWLIVVVLVVGGYVDAFARARGAGRSSVPAWRPACFLAGGALLLVTVSSSINAYAMSLFWVHMVEHLILIMVVPGLLVLGHPLSVARDALGDRGRERFDAAMRSFPVAILTHPVITFLLYAMVIIGTHLTGFMDAMEKHSWLMPAEQAAYVVSGYLFMLTLLGREPTRYNLPYLPRVMLILIGMVPDTIVGLVLLQTNHVLFPTMFAAHPSWAPEAVDDQQIAGSLMWAFGDGLMMVTGVVVVAMMIADKDRGRVLGKWLESARSQTLDHHVSVSGGAAMEKGIDLDDSDAALDAYNAMLGRIGRSE